ncbi:inhibitor of Bruton tyrosine kinase-like [Brachionus plicatilis]|uniref:Inhibitor of Bruton tyrosine kinase-like n=1 Tax=Brachionus plicatilis TaxID=10195 RepID=A0A3M7TC80_BRAPC|nr:inhibitor of Bruton tyrosine kinase-like [Brachionus plicatilis]
MILFLKLKTGVQDIVKFKARSHRLEVKYKIIKPQDLPEKKIFVILHYIFKNSLQLTVNQGRYTFYLVYFEIFYFEAFAASITNKNEGFLFNLYLKFTTLLDFFKKVATIATWNGKKSCGHNLDVYSWGSNENYNLGMGHEMKKAHAEMVEFFKKQNIAISQIKMSKFHTVFMTKSGEVYTCGFGMDGRLGHQNELTLVSPKQVEALKSEKITQIEACRNNSYFLTCEGVLYGCGTNEFKQLGQLDVAKSLGPRPISGGRRLKAKMVKNFACSRFHVVLVTTSNEVYTFGLNAGQLGHPSDSMSCVAEPRLISHLNEPDIDISLVACSDGSTVCLQPSKNVIHLFSDYKVRKLYYTKEVGACFVKIKVIGGKLDPMAESELKWIKNLAEPVTIVGLTEKNALFVWREQENSWKSLAWAKNKNFKIVDFDLSNSGVVFCTVQGSCYRAEFKNKLPKMSTSPTKNF